MSRIFLMMSFLSASTPMLADSKPVLGHNRYPSRILRSPLQWESDAVSYGNVPSWYLRALAHVSAGLIGEDNFIRQAFDVSQDFTEDLSFRLVAHNDVLATRGGRLFFHDIEVNKSAVVLFFDGATADSRLEKVFYSVYDNDSFSGFFSDTLMLSISSQEGQSFLSGDALALVRENLPSNVSSFVHPLRYDPYLRAFVAPVLTVPHLSEFASANYMCEIFLVDVGSMTVLSCNAFSRQGSLQGNLLGNTVGLSGTSVNSTVSVTPIRNCVVKYTSPGGEVVQTLTDENGDFEFLNTETGGSVSVSRNREDVRLFSGVVAQDDPGSFLTLQDVDGLQSVSLNEDPSEFTTGDSNLFSLLTDFREYQLQRRRQFSTPVEGYQHRWLDDQNAFYAFKILHFALPSHLVSPGGLYFNAGNLDSVDDNLLIVFGGTAQSADAATSADVTLHEFFHADMYSIVGRRDLGDAASSDEAFSEAFAFLSVWFYKGQKNPENYRIGTQGRGMIRSRPDAFVIQMFEGQHCSLDPSEDCRSGLGIYRPNRIDLSSNEASLPTIGFITDCVFALEQQFGLAEAGERIFAALRVLVHMQQGMDIGSFDPQMVDVFKFVYGRLGFGDASFMDAIAVNRNLSTLTRQAFVRGDANNDRNVDISDAVFSLQYLFLQGRVFCLDAADVNDDANVDVSDVVYTLSYLFRGGRPIPPPNRCNFETEDNLSCETSPPRCLVIMR